jgi:broad specificity phosphatase PhoE
MLRKVNVTDIIDRIKHFILELERTDDTVLIVTHTAVLRCILGYFVDEKLEDIPYMDVPLHKLFKLTSDKNEYKVTSIQLEYCI